MSRSCVYANESKFVPMTNHRIYRLGERRLRCAIAQHVLCFSDEGVRSDEDEKVKNVVQKPRNVIHRMLSKLCLMSAHEISKCFNNIDRPSNSYPFPSLGLSPFPLRGLESAVSSPSGVRGGAPAAKAILAYHKTRLVASI